MQQTRLCKLLGGVVLAVASTGRAESSAPEAAYSLELHGRFFQHATGKFDTDDAIKLGGWNAFVHTQIALVLVEVEGGPFPFPKGASLEFSARTKRRILQHRWLKLGDEFFSESGHVSIPFLLHGMGCDPIELRAKLSVRGKVQATGETMPMACGE